MTDAVRTALELAIKLEAEGHGAEASVIAAAVHHLLREHVKSTLVLQRVMKTMEELERELCDLPPEARVPEGSFARIQATLRDWRHEKVKLAAINQEKAKRPRRSKYPDWMREEALACSAGKKKPSAILALDHIQSAATARGYYCEMPDESTVRKWISEVRKKSGINRG